jgi:hypothetical protein
MISDYYDRYTKELQQRKATELELQKSKKQIQDLQKELENARKELVDRKREVLQLQLEVEIQKTQQRYPSVIPRDNT